VFISTTKIDEISYFCSYKLCVLFCWYQKLLWRLCNKRKQQQIVLFFCHCR